MRSFVCNIVPNNMVVEMKTAQAANNFCYGLVDGKCFDKIISVVPYSYVKNNIPKEDGGIDFFYGKKSKSKLVNILRYLFQNFKCAKTLKKSNAVWFYNINNANFICFLLLRFIYRTPCYAILLDYTPCKSKLKLAYYFPWMYKKCKGMISLSSRTPINHTNIGYKAGVLNVSNIISPKPTNNKKLKFLFTGNLAPHMGLPLVIDVFKKMPDCEVYISGHGKKTEIPSDYPNIHYLGYMDYSDFIALYDKIDVCLSFRDPKDGRNTNNFPSKIIEYFCHSKIVLSTIKYNEIDGFNYVYCPYEKDAVIQKINELQSLNPEELEKLSDNTEALNESFSADSWIELFTKIEFKNK